MNTPDAAPVALDTWPRREAYTFFSGLSDPFYSVTVTMDVTALHTYTKKRGLSFYYALVWLCTQSINHTTAFRYAIRNGSRSCSRAVNRASRTCTRTQNSSTS